MELDHPEGSASYNDHALLKPLKKYKMCLSKHFLQLNKAFAGFCILREPVR